MAKSRSTPGRPGRHEGSRRSSGPRYESERSSPGGSRYGSEYSASTYGEQELERETNGGSRSRSYDYEDESRGFVRRMGRKFSEMDMEKAMILLHTALAIAIVIKQSRDRDRGRRGEPFRSAVSVLNHYLNEGRELSDAQRATLEDIKDELRMLYDREEEESYSPSSE